MSKDQKIIIRKEILSLLRNQKEEDRLRKSLVIQKKFFSTAEFQKAKTILFYAAFDGEVETFDMMRQAQRHGKNIALPYIMKEDKTIVPILIDSLEEDLEIGSYGIKQPKYVETRSLNPDKIDLVVVPGLAFDRENYRLGRGLGFYDRFLKNFPSPTPSVGFAFDFQIIAHLPRQEHDVPVSLLITD